MLTTKTTATNISFGDNVSVALSVARGHCVVAAESVTGYVTEVREKAVQINTHNTQKSVWFPKKALVKGATTDGKTKSFQVAHWFTPDARQWNAVETSF